MKEFAETGEETKRMRRMTFYALRTDGDAQPKMLGVTCHCVYREKSASRIAGE